MPKANNRPRYTRRRRTAVPYFPGMITLMRRAQLREPVVCKENTITQEEFDEFIKLAFKQREKGGITQAIMLEPDNRYKRKWRRAFKNQSTTEPSYVRSYVDMLANGLKSEKPEYIPVKYEDVCKPNDTLNMQILKGTAAVKISWRKRMGLCE